MNKPKISIVTITYNSEKTLKETIESIVAQGYEDLEYIIVDGGSKDRTMEIVKQYADTVTKSVSEPDNGISDAFNKGIRMASGDIIGIINSDDMLNTNALNTLADAYDGTTDIYYGNAIVCDEEGAHLHVLRSKADLSEMPYQFSIVHPATFVTKAAYEKYGLFDVDLKCAMDYDFLLRAYKNDAIFKYVDAPLSIYRLGGVNMKMRRRTIDEVRDVSVKHGANKQRANRIRLKKILVDKLRPLQKLLKIKNQRIEKL